MATSAAIVQRLWNYCNVLRDDGVSYGDYVEQLTYLLFLKMADEQTPLAGQAPAPSPRVWTGRACWRATATNWRRTTATSSTSWAEQRAARHHLPQGPEQDPGPGQAAPADRADRRRDLGGPGHRRQGRHLRGAAGEERPGHQDRRRPVLHAPPADPGHRGRDAPAPGDDHLRPGLRHRRLPPRRPRLHRRATTNRSTREQRQHLKHEALRGWEIVDSAARLCVMNLYLHGIGATASGDSPIVVGDASSPTPATASTWC